MSACRLAATAFLSAAFVLGSAAPPAHAAGPFPLVEQVADLVKAEFIEPVDEARLERAALEGMLAAARATADVPASLPVPVPAPAPGAAPAAGRFAALDTAYGALRERLEHGAIRAMLASLDDPYTRFLDPAAFKAMNDDRQGSYPGIGAQIGIVEGKLAVIAPFDGSPAQKAGLRGGDRIVEIDGQAAADLPVDVAVSRIRGPAGTEVRIAVRRANRALFIPITRGAIVIKPVRTRDLGPDVGYIRLASFYDSAADTEMQKAIDQLAAKKALVLDLRGNPGGFVDEAVAIGTMFIPAGPIVTQVDRAGNRQVRPEDPDKPRTPAWPQTKRLVALVDGGTASAAEILSGALQDSKAAVIVGPRTFGKGVVQTIVPLSGGGGLAVTAARYLTPGGHDINKKGIQPDVVVELPKPADPGQIPTLDEHIAAGTDTQLAAALKLLARP